MHRDAEILDYWFGDQPDDSQLVKKRGGIWFGKNEKVDREIRERFGSRLLELGAGAEIDNFGLTSRQRLARIILLDQFPRNIYRGAARSFAFDAAALKLCLEGLELAQDQQLRPIERTFFYLPLEHSEELEHQERSVALFRKLLEDVPDDWQKSFAGFLDYAIRHQEIIERFGRFPHRNKILGRTSTAEELAFLALPNSSF